MRRLLLAALLLAACQKSSSSTPSEAPSPAPSAAPAASPDTERVWKEALQRGRELEKSGDHAAAVKALDEALAARPDDPEALSELGWAAFQARDLERSKAASAKAIEKATAPNLKAAALYNLGRALEDGGDKAGALAAYDESLRLRPNQTVDKRRAALAGGGDEAGFRTDVAAMAKARTMTVVGWGSAPLDDSGKPVLFATLEPSEGGETGLYILRTADGKWWSLVFDYDGKTRDWVGGERAEPPPFVAVADAFIDHNQPYSGGYMSCKTALRGGVPVILEKEVLGDVREGDKPETTTYEKDGVCAKPCPPAAGSEFFGRVSGPVASAAELR